MNNKLNANETIVWLNYLFVDNRHILKLLDCYGDISQVFIASKNELMELNILKEEKIDYIIANRDYDKIKRIYTEYERFDSRIITILDDDYPTRLHTIDNKPAVIYVKGDILPCDELSFSIVGSRKLTEYGRSACEYLSSELAKLGITIISGMASGADSVAHNSAINAGGRTIAVLGSGLNIIYPKKNEKLYYKIAQNGAVISEFPANTKGVSYNFPRRNRIISGMGLGVLVIEAMEKSGSLITASYAAEQGRDVFAVPGNINSLYSRGTNKLIQDGAKLVMMPEDILNEIREFIPLIKDEEENINLDLTDDEFKIYDIISQAESSLDEILIKTDLDIKTAQTIVTKLELMDIIRSSASGKYIINVKGR